MRRERPFRAGPHITPARLGPEFRRFRTLPVDLQRGRLGPFPGRRRFDAVYARRRGKSGHFRRGIAPEPAQRRPKCAAVDGARGGQQRETPSLTCSSMSIDATSSESTMTSHCAVSHARRAPVTVSTSAFGPRTSGLLEGTFGPFPGRPRRAGVTATSRGNGGVQG